MSQPESVQRLLAKWELFRKKHNEVLITYLKDKTEEHKAILDQISFIYYQLEDALLFANAHPEQRQMINIRCEQIEYLLLSYEHTSSQLVRDMLKVFKSITIVPNGLQMLAKIVETMGLSTIESTPVRKSTARLALISQPSPSVRSRCEVMITQHAMYLILHVGPITEGDFELLYATYDPEVVDTQKLVLEMRKHTQTQLYSAEPLIIYQDRRTQPIAFNLACASLTALIAHIHGLCVNADIYVGKNKFYRFTDTSPTW